MPKHAWTRCIWVIRVEDNDQLALVDRGALSRHIGYKPTLATLVTVFRVRRIRAAPAAPLSFDLTVNLKGKPSPVLAGFPVLPLHFVRSSDVLRAQALPDEDRTSKKNGSPGKDLSSSSVFGQSRGAQCCRAAKAHFHGLSLTWAAPTSPTPKKSRKTSSVGGLEEQLVVFLAPFV